MSRSDDHTRPVILTTAMGYRHEALAPFIATCRKHLPTATIVVFASGLDRETSEWLERQPHVETIRDNFNPHQVHAGWRLAAAQLRSRAAYHIARTLLGRGGACGDNGERLAESLFSVVIQRFFRYRRFLAESGHRFTHALLADIRDVVFQSDPFPCEGLHVFSENEQIGQNHFARRWFQLAYGWSSWRTWQHKPLLNVGTTLGDVVSVGRYLDTVCSEYVRRLAFFWGADTAVHNYVIHSGQVAANVHLFGDGAVLTLNAVPLTSLRLAGGRVLNPAGQPYPILHQYDRVEGLQLDLRTEDLAT